MSSTRRTETPARRISELLRAVVGAAARRSFDSAGEIDLALGSRLMTAELRYCNAPDEIDARRGRMSRPNGTAARAAGQVSPDGE